MITVPLASERLAILEDDESINKEHSNFDWDQFKKTGDEKFCPCKEGGRLAKFKIAPLAVRAYEQVMNLRDKPTSMAWEAVALGLVSSDGFFVGGIEAQWKRHKVNGLWRLTEESMERNFKPSVYYELSGRIMEISSLDF